MLIDEAACRQKWPKIRARHAEILKAVTIYRLSREVQDGAIMSPMKFISGRFRDWLDSGETPIGLSPPNTVHLEIAEQERRESVPYEERKPIPRQAWMRGAPE